MKKQTPPRLYNQETRLSTAIIVTSVSAYCALSSPAFGQTIESVDTPVNIQQQRPIVIDPNLDLQRPLWDLKNDFNDQDEFVIGKTDLQPGADKPPKPVVNIGMEKPEAIKVSDRSNAERGGMLNIDSIKIYTPEERFENGGANLQIPDVRVADGKGDQIANDNVPNGQHVKFNFVIEGSNIYVQDVTSVPGSVQSSRYLQGSLVWRAIVSDKPVALGSLSDPRLQHSLIRGKHDAEEPAPGLAEKAYFSIPLSEKYLSSNVLSEMWIEFFTLDPTVPTNTELTNQNFDEVINQRSELVGRVEGRDLYVALYDQSNNRRK